MFSPFRYKNTLLHIDTFFNMAYIIIKFIEIISKQKKVRAFTLTNNH